MSFPYSEGTETLRFASSLPKQALGPSHSCGHGRPQVSAPSPHVHSSDITTVPQQYHISSPSIHGCVPDSISRLHHRLHGALGNSLLYKIFPNEESKHPYFSYRLHRAPLQLPHTQPFLNCPIAVPLLFLPAAQDIFATASYPIVSESQNRSTPVFRCGCTGRLRNHLIPNRFQIAKSQYPRFSSWLHGPVV